MYKKELICLLDNSGLERNKLIIRIAEALQQEKKFKKVIEN
jgi:hypothetical protein